MASQLEYLEIIGLHVLDIKDDAIAKLTNLEYLLVTDSGLRNLRINSLGTLGNLTALSLQRNLISSIDAGSFDALSQLSVLKLSLNRLSSISATIFNKLSKLTILHLGSNQLTTLPAEVFKANTMLQQLDLSGNMLSDLSAPLSHVTTLEFLNVSYNPSLTLESNMWESLSTSSLRVLDVSFSNTRPSASFCGKDDSLSVLFATNVGLNTAAGDFKHHEFVRACFGKVRVMEGGVAHTFERRQMAS
jgi:Leucine-rich repeat (LRR) protein